MFNSRLGLKPFIIWILPLSFFAYQFTLRLWPSLLMQQIMGQFHIDAKNFGLLASAYYYGYAIMQIPMAIMLDTYKPRYVIGYSAIICSIAVLLFTYADNWYLALFSRFLIGATSAVGFLGTSKIISQWFDEKYYARMIGFTFTIGLLGAVYGGKPINLLITNLGSESVSLSLAFAAFFIGLAAILFLAQPKVTSEKVITKITFFDLKTLLSYRIIWFLAAANLLMVGSLEGFADVWGVNYLMMGYGLTKDNAAQLTSFIFIGMLFGGPLLAFFAKFSNNYFVILACGLGMAILFCKLIFLREDLSLDYLPIIFSSIGIMCCYQVLIFDIGSKIVPVKLLGVTVAFLNAINMLGGAFFHSSIGILMNFFSCGEGLNGIKEYNLESYQKSLIIIPLCSILGAIIIGTIRSMNKKSL